jgi:hypothetical protein
MHGAPRRTHHSTGRYAMKPRTSGEFRRLDFYVIAATWMIHLIAANSYTTLEQQS